MSKNIYVVLAAIVALSASSTFAAVLYSENFEGSIPGQDLSTLGFTYLAGGTAVVQNTAEMGLAFDGRNGNGSSQDPGLLGVRHLVPTTAGGASKIEFDIDIYVPASEPNANQAFTIYGNPAGGRWAEAGYTGSDFTVRLWDSAGAVALSHSFGMDITDAVVNMKLVADITNGLLWGEINGTPSPTVPFAAGSESFLSEIEIFNDQRAGTGQGSIWDNILVTEIPIPEPLSIILLGWGGVAGAVMLWHRRKS